MTSQSKKETQPRLLSTCCNAGFLKMVTEEHGRKEENPEHYKLIRRVVQRCDACKNECEVEIKTPEIKK